MTDNELKMMNALGSVHDYFYELEDLVACEKQEHSVCKVCSVILGECEHCKYNNPDPNKERVRRSINSFTTFSDKDTPFVIM